MRLSASVCVSLAWTALGCRAHDQTVLRAELSPERQSNAMRAVVYYTNWATYGRKHKPQDLPVESLTHILYAFANVQSDSGRVVLTDAWSDEQIHYDGDSWNDVGSNLYGNLKQLYLHKRNRNPALKLLLSIGGWTYSPNFAPMIGDPQKRATFVTSSIALLEDYALDGLDVDFEYPKNDSEAGFYVDLLRELREGLDRHAQSKGDPLPYELTIAAPCGESHYSKLHVAAMDRHLSFWNLMAYDFAGSWDPVAGHQANLRGGAISVERAVDFYRSRGVAADKLVVGMPLYGRSFANTDGIGRPFQGVGQGSWEAGVYDYKALPLPGSEVKTDGPGASYCYSAATRELVSFDTLQVAEEKARWIRQQGLGGGMWWDSSGDHPPGHPQSIIEGVARVLKPLDATSAHLSYPGSKFDNVRAGMS